MAKKVTQPQQTGRTGEVFVGFLFQNMGQIWHESRSDAGIDCHVEIRDTETTEATNRHIGVQVKSYSGRFHGETDDSFEYFCSDADLDYWLRGTMPVILVCCRPSTREAYWADIHERFSAPESRKTKKVVFSKAKSKLDEDALPALKKIALPEEMGLYLGSPPRNEKLYSNLIRVTRLPEKIYVGEAIFTKRSQVFAALKEKGITLPSAEFITRDNKIISANDVRAQPWSELVEKGTVEEFSFQEWVGLDENHGFYAFELLNHCLQGFLSSRSVRWHKGDELFYFKASRGQMRMKVKTKGLHREETSHTVVQSYFKKNSAEVAYFRHHAIIAKFYEFDGEWFLQITPTYRFTRDGWNDDRFGSERLKKIKEFEGNQGIFGIALMWANYLSVDVADAFTSGTHHVGFGELLSFDAQRGIPDAAWRPPTKPSSGEDDELLLDT